ncbi:MAG: hypothetical protein WC438_00895 [Candidatus Pacearchaeota archaeon]
MKRGISLIIVSLLLITLITTVSAAEKTRLFGREDANSTVSLILSYRLDGAAIDKQLVKKSTGEDGMWEYRMMTDEGSEVNIEADYKGAIKEYKIRSGTELNIDFGEENPIPASNEVEVSVEVNNSEETITDNESINADQESITGFAVTDTESSFNIKTIYYVIGGGILLVIIILIIIFTATRKVKSKKGGTYLDFKIKPQNNQIGAINEKIENKDAELNMVESKLEEVKRELEDIKNKKKRIQETRERFERDKRELEELERD